MARVAPRARIASSTDMPVFSVLDSDERKARHGPRVSVDGADSDSDGFDSETYGSGFSGSVAGFLTGVGFCFAAGDPFGFGAFAGSFFVTGRSTSVSGTIVSVTGGSIWRSLGFFDWIGDSLTRREGMPGDSAFLSFACGSVVSGSSESKSQRSVSVPFAGLLPEAGRFFGVSESGAGESVLMIAGWWFLECRAVLWRVKKIARRGKGGEGWGGMQVMVIQSCLFKLI